MRSIASGRERSSVRSMTLVSSGVCWTADMILSENMNRGAFIYTFAALWLSLRVTGPTFKS